MGKKVAELSPKLLMDLLADGHVLGGGQFLVVVKGIPVGTSFVWAGYGGTVEQEGPILLLLENSDWPESPKCGDYPRLAVEMMRFDEDERADEGFLD